MCNQAVMLTTRVKVQTKRTRFGDAYARYGVNMLAFYSRFGVKKQCA